MFQSSILKHDTRRFSGSASGRCSRKCLNSSTWWCFHTADLPWIRSEKAIAGAADAAGLEGDASIMVNLVVGPPVFPMKKCKRLSRGFCENCGTFFLDLSISFLDLPPSSFIFLSSRSSLRPDSTRVGQGPHTCRGGQLSPQGVLHTRSSTRSGSIG